MDIAGALLTLQWTALFAGQMLVALGDVVALLLGAALATGWLALPRRGPIGRSLVWLLRLATLTLAAVLLLAHRATWLTGDPVLAAQLRAGTVHEALTCLIGAGAVFLLRLIRDLRVGSTDRSLPGRVQPSDPG